MDSPLSAGKPADATLPASPGQSGSPVQPPQAAGPRASVRIGVSHTPGVPSDAAASPVPSKSPVAAAAAPSSDDDDSDISDVDVDAAGDGSDDANSDMEDDDQPPQAAPLTPEELAAEAAARALEFKDKGNDAYKAGEYAEAVAHYTAAVNLVPTDAMYYANRAAAYLMLNKFKEVLEDCAKTHSIEPLHVKAHLRAGKAHFKLGNFMEAERSYGAALKQEPRNAEALRELKSVSEVRKLVERGDEAMRAGNARLALVCYDSALAQAPDSEHVQVGKLKLLLAAKRFDEALAITTKMLRDKSSSTAMLQVRAKCYYFQADLDKAKKTLLTALQMDPDDGECQRDLRLVKKLQGLHTAGNEAFEAMRWTQALEQYTLALGVDATNEQYNLKLYNNRAAVYMKLNNNAAAVQDCNAVLAMDENNVKAVARRAQCLMALGGVDNLEQAVRDFETAKRLVGDATSQRKFMQDIRTAQAALKAAKRKDYYKILEIPRDADEAAVKRAYYKAAKKWHPDRHSSADESVRLNAERVFKDVSEAYEVLSDATKRRRYDAGADLAELDQEEHHHGHGGFGGFGGGGMPDIFQMFGGMGGGMGGGQRFYRS